MLQGILSMFRIEDTNQLRELLQNFGHFLPPEQLELITAVVMELDKGEDMNREALALAADYISAGAAELQGQLPQTELTAEQLPQEEITIDNAEQTEIS